MVRDRVIEIFRQALAQGAADGRWPANDGGFAVEAPRDPKHGDFAVNAAMVLARAAGQAASRARAGHRRGGPRGRRAAASSPRSRSRAPASSTCGSRRTSGSARSARAWRRRGVRPDAGGAGEEGHRRVRVGEPHRPHARGPRPERGRRGRGPEPAPLGRLRRHPRVLRERLRRAGADARALGPPPLPGAARPARHHAAEELPGRVREGHRRRAEGRARRPVPRRARGGVAHAVPRPGRAARARDHPGGPPGHRHLVRPLDLGEGALRVRDGGPLPAVPRGEGARLRREAPAPEVEEGAGRAAAAPRPGRTATPTPPTRRSSPPPRT